MNKIKTITSVIVVSLLLIACSVGVKKDLMSGLSIKYDGFAVGNSFLVKDNQKTTDVKIKPGQDISVVFTGITGFKEIDGKVYPGASIVVVDSKGKTVLDIADLFSSYDSTGVDTKMVQEALSIKFTAPPTGSEKGEIYSWKSKVWDKKGKSTLDCELQLEVSQ
ncbi:MAG: hypothetical protein ABIP51_08245 [Bacteroidia bacterium]